ncbi:hypothetical protein [Nocardia fluminea]|uniref:hypothetical protein n=1 Tax=Nocardia fluminea TaxID=134984 RepID=UPI003D12F602
MVGDDGALTSPYYGTGAQLTSLDSFAGPCTRGCKESPGPCGLCGITVVMKSHHLDVLYSQMKKHPKLRGRVVATRVLITPPLHWTAQWLAFSSEETNGAPFIVSGVDNRAVGEARAAAVRIEAMQLPTALAHMAGRIGTRYGLNVAVGDTLADLAEP